MFNVAKLVTTTYFQGMWWVCHGNSLHVGSSRSRRSSLLGSQHRNRSHSKRGIQQPHMFLEGERKGERSGWREGEIGDEGRMGRNNEVGRGEGSRKR